MTVQPAAEVTAAPYRRFRWPAGVRQSDSRGEPVPLREILVHMTEECARRNGHADCPGGRLRAVS